MPVAKKTTFGECKLKSCKVRFRKKRKDQLFCCRPHKDAYYKRGQFPFEKMCDDIMRLVRAELAPLVKRISALESDLERGLPDNINFEGIKRINDAAAKRNGGNV